MLDLDTVKTWLRLEVDEDAEDDILMTLIEAAQEYVRNAVGPEIDLYEPNPLAKLLAMTLIVDWYEHRAYTGQVRMDLRPTVQGLVSQLQNAYPASEEG